MEMLILKLVSLAISSGMLTELVKWGWEKIATAVPPKWTPVIAMLAGAVTGEGANLAMPDLGLGPELGAAGGAMATALHQLKRLFLDQPAMVQSPPPGFRSWLPILALLTAMTGCASQPDPVRVAREACDLLPAAQAALVAAQAIAAEVPDGTDAERARQAVRTARQVAEHLQAACAAYVPPEARGPAS